MFGGSHRVLSALLILNEARKEFEILPYQIQSGLEVRPVSLKRHHQKVMNNMLCSGLIEKFLLGKEHIARS